MGAHKSLRRIFLFEELLLFSKPRRGPTGIDMFTYKLSFKVGSTGPLPALPSTPTASLSSSPGHTDGRSWPQLSAVGTTTCALRSGFAVARLGLVLQAASLATKQAWTADISRLLWRQAIHNKGGCLSHFSSHDPPPWRAYIVPEGPQRGPQELETLGRVEKVQQQQPAQEKELKPGGIMSPSQAADM